MIDSRYQTFWRRFWAGNIDALVILPLAFIDPWKHSQQLPIFLLVLWFIFHETAWYFYSVLMHGRYGQTLGKMVCKVKVVDKSEAKPITYRQAFFRDSPWIVVGLIFSIMMLPVVLQGKDPYQIKEAKQVLAFLLWSSIGTLWFIAELVTMLTSKKRRAIHDLIAGSVVINDRSNKSFPLGKQQKTAVSPRKKSIDIV